MVYIDDIIVYSETFEEHLRDIENVLQRLQSAKLKVKPTKCEWAKEEVTFLGHIVSRKGIKPDPSKVDKVKNYPKPKKLKEVQAFLGLANYYRRFIPKFADIAKPLRDLTHKGVEFKWNEKHDKAMADLIRRLTEAPILQFPDVSKPFFLMTDASEFAIGAVLGQKDEQDREHVIAYLSRRLTPCERNYSVIEKECLAIIYAFKQFRQYLLGQKTYLYTDHQPLMYLRDIRNVTGRLARWSLALAEYDIEIKYRRGESNKNADFMSRLENVDEKGDIKIMMIEVASSGHGIIEAQRNDPELKYIIESIQLGTLKEELTQKYKLVDNVLYYMKGDTPLTMIPESKKVPILIQYHDGALGGHLSKKKTLTRILQKYYWKTVNDDVNKWVKECNICATRKNTGSKTRVPLKPLPIPLSPMEFTAMDVMGPLPITNNGNKYILVFSDYQTRWPEAFAMPN